MYKFYVLSVLLTIVWSLGVTVISPLLYVVNLFPVFGLILWHKKVMYSRRTMIMFILLFCNIIYFKGGFIFGLKLASYIATLILCSSVEFKISRKVLNFLFVFSIGLFVLNKYTELASSNFFFQRNSFPSFLFGLVALITYRKDTLEGYKLLVAVAFVTVVSGTIGALLALLLAVIFTSNIAYIGLKSFFALLALILFHNYFFEISTVERVLTMYDYIFSKISIIDLIFDTSLTFGTFATEEFTDVSALFRLFHWREIILYFIYGNGWSIFFGYGLDSVKFVLPLSMHKYPHNDLLRVLVECGLFFWILFYKYVVTLIKGLKGPPMLYTAALIFFLFTENLLNNYISTLPIFILIGEVIREMRNERSSY